MTRIFYDTEFLEDGKTIELISIGMVTEKGDEYYAVNRNMPWHRIYDHSWLMENVMSDIPKLGSSDPTLKLKTTIAHEVRDFVLKQSNPELWAWYGAYDHVVLCQLFGKMIDLPHGFPMWTNDLKQEVMRLGDPILPMQISKAHNALNDAFWVREVYWILNDGN